MLSYVWIGIGSALGGMSRYWLTGLVAARAGNDFPWGTIVVNVTGSFLIGLVAALAASDGRALLGNTARDFLAVGVLGGYTTFSAFSLQTLDLARAGQWGAAAANVGLSVVLCLIAVWLGYMAATTVVSR